MKLLFPFSVIGSIAVLLGAAEASDHKPAEKPISCDASAELTDWLESILVKWGRFTDLVLAQPQASVPLIVIIGEHCSWRLSEEEPENTDGQPLVSRPFGNRDNYLSAFPHDGEIDMPNGDRMPVGPMAFTSTYDQDSRPFFAISSLPLWRQVVANAPNFDVPSFFRGVAIHELVHTVQIVWSTREITGLIEEFGIEGDVNDDMFQDRFGSDPEYEAAYRAERQAFLEALESSDKNALRQRAEEAMALYRDRQSKFFGEQPEAFPNIEDIFLTMEGSSIWASFEIEPPEGATGSAAVAKYYAGKDGAWIQDEGMLIAALVDELVPNWKARVFRGEPELITDLLEEAFKAKE